MNSKINLMYIVWGAGSCGKACDFPRIPRRILPVSTGIGASSRESGYGSKLEVSASPLIVGTIGAEISLLTSASQSKP